MNENLEAFNLSLIFRDFFIKYDRKIFTPKTIVKSKWWPYFVDTINKFSRREGWNPNIFIEAQFYFKDNKLYPPELTTEKAWKNFIDYLNYKSRENEEEVIVRNVLNGFSAVKNYCTKNKKTFSVAEFINNEYNKNKIINNEMPVDFFLFSKAFKEKFQIKNDIKKLLIYSNKQLLEKIKQVLKEDYE